MRKTLREFSGFAFKGNVVDMAVGVVIGGAFGQIVTSLVNDIIMPPIGAALNGMNFSDFSLVLKPAQTNAAGDVTAAVTLNYGNFIQVFINFLIIAIWIFFFVKLITAARKRFEKKQDSQPTKPPEPTKEEILLTEIRDLLAKKNYTGE